jgi:hypothetical protein
MRDRVMRWWQSKKRMEKPCDRGLEQFPDTYTVKLSVLKE